MAKKRSTYQKEILSTELNTIDTFFTAEELHNRVKKEHKNVSIATVYRFLSESVANRELYVYTCGRKSVYSRGDRAHCHFICEKTGKITHFKIDSLDFLRDKIPGELKSFQLEVKGICREHCMTCTKIKKMPEKPLPNRGRPTGHS